MPTPLHRGACVRTELSGPGVLPQERVLPIVLAGRSPGWGTQEREWRCGAKACLLAELTGVPCTNGVYCKVVIPLPSCDRSRVRHNHGEMAFLGGRERW